MEKHEWYCPLCRELNYGFINEYTGKQCKNCKRTIYIRDGKEVPSWDRKI